MNKNDIVTLVAVTGAEYVGKFESEGSDTFVIREPYIVTPQGESLGFMPTVAMSGKPELNTVTFQKTGIITVVPTADEVAKAYIKSSSGIVLQ